MPDTITQQQNNDILRNSTINIESTENAKNITVEKKDTINNEHKIPTDGEIKEIKPLESKSEASYFQSAKTAVGNYLKKYTEDDELTKNEPA